MAEIVRMPKMSDTMTEGVVAKWHKKVGEKVNSGDLVAEIETDKATMEYESYQEGVLLYQGVKEGSAVEVNAVLAILGEKGEDYKELLDQEKSNQQKEAPKAEQESTPKEEVKKVEVKESVSKKEEKAVERKVEKVSSVTNGAVSDSRLKASPLARKMASEKGIDLAKLLGSGADGRIVKRDLDWYKPGNFAAGQSISGVTEESYSELSVSQMRKTIARRLGESKFTAPHFYLTMQINMDKVVEAREVINALIDVKVSFNDFVIKACASSLRQHLVINSSWQGDMIRTNNHIHIGVAVGMDEGLLVPVVRFADSKTLSQISSEVRELASKAKNKKLQPSDWEGNTFSISNLGMFNIDEFTAIINPPDACILAVGAIQQVPIVKNGQLQAGNIMKVTLSCDHRVVDGVSGSKFLNTLKNLLENPIVLLGEGNI
ncbi:MAG TPA: pyruvate dehydrogenase complex dihydrolipoamide acetyltransferase [Bacteroidia bacterium]|nr:pyruvate dehydrogenase complex dihydrolipoamide acetyltransferase [Bacteroidia bacterium]